MNLIAGVVVVMTLLASVVFAQSAGVVGSWEGKINSPQGERPMNASFKKEGDAYSGTVTAMSRDVPLSDIKVEGNKVSAKANIDTGQAVVTINYKLTLDGDKLNGTGDVDFGGQSFTFDVELKRAAAGGTAAAPAAQTPPAARPAGPGGQQAGGGQQGGGGAQGRPGSPPQPMQKQSADYFVGTWTTKVTGRESALGMAPRTGTVTFTKNANGSLTGKGTSTFDGGKLDEDITINYDDATKMITMSEKRSNGVTIKSTGDWTSPISIRFTVEPIKAGKQTLSLRRTISVVSAFSFTVVEELSEDGGPFVRLSSALFSKPGAN
jgi:hypothetical protein